MASIPNALSIDVEDYFQVGVFQGSIRPEEWVGFESRVERNVDLILAMLQEHDVRATFFVLGWIAEHYPSVVRRIAEAGHEIGSHGQSHLPIWRQDPDRLREDIRRSQGLLGDLLGEAPKLYRAPCFSVTQDTLWALDIIYEEGIRLDSSIFPVSHPEYGIPDAERGIHEIALDGGGILTEFPMTAGEGVFRKAAFSGGGWFRLAPYWLSRRSLRRVVDSGRPFVFYLHPWELDPDQPRLSDRCSLTGRFRHYVNLSRTEPRLRQLLVDFEFATLGNVVDQVRQQQGALRRLSYSSD